MSAYAAHPENYVVYGPDVNCTLALCPVQASVYQYRPSLAVNVLFLVLFGIALIVHILLGLKYKTWVFCACMMLGCITEVIGYGGRIILWQNPFSFEGFLMQIITITLGPAFFSAAIYLTLSRIIVYLGPQYARFSPKLYYWMFIPCDMISLVVQSIGGALSSISSGKDKTAVNVAIAGLSFQVFTLLVFIGLAIEYGVRYWKAQGRTAQLPTKFKVFVFFLSFSIVVILARCTYRIDELSDGYLGPLIHEQGLFIALEGVMITLAAYALMIAHPGPIFAWPDADGEDIELKGGFGDTTSNIENVAEDDVESQREGSDTVVDDGDIIEDDAKSKREAADIVVNTEQSKQSE